MTVSALLVVAAVCLGSGLALAWSRAESFRAYRAGFLDGDRAGWLRAVRLAPHARDGAGAEPSGSPAATQPAEPGLVQEYTPLPEHTVLREHTPLREHTLLAGSTLLPEPTPAVACPPPVPARRSPQLVRAGAARPGVPAPSPASVPAGLARANGAAVPANRVPEPVPWVVGPAPETRTPDAPTGGAYGWRTWSSGAPAGAATRHWTPEPAAWLPVRCLRIPAPPAGTAGTVYHSTTAAAQQATAACPPAPCPPARPGAPAAGAVPPGPVPPGSCRAHPRSCG